MNKEIFLERFQQAAIRARDFGQERIEEPLANEVRCRLQMNSSYDGHPLDEDETVFPQDSSPEGLLNLASLTVEEAADVLWRDGKVPEWIDVAVVTKTRRYTVVAVESCGRFTENDDLLYHVQGKYPPFQVVGPALPWDHVEGELFSIFYWSSCWTPEELDMAKKHSSRSRSLELTGAYFDDKVLSTLGAFPALEILELKVCPLQGFGLSGCAQMPKLRSIRMNRFPIGELSLSDLPYLPKLEGLSLSGLNEPPDLAVLETATPRLDELSLEFTSTERIVNIPHLDTLTMVTIKADHLRHGVRFSDANQIRNIVIEGNQSDAEVLRILEQLPALTVLNLYSMGVTDEIVRFLSHNTQLCQVNLSGTKVSDTALDSLQAEYPKMKISPKPPCRRKSSIEKSNK
jgi:hypothetical protein